MVLASFGAHVIKIENTDYGPDPFISEEAKKYTPHFEDWYKKINKEKKVIKFSFSKKESLLFDHMNKANIIIIPDSTFFNDCISKILKEEITIIKITGGKDEWRSLHDLNALALTNTFKEHLKNDEFPPYLPFAGISFAQYIATTSLAALRKTEQTKKQFTCILYLKEITKFLLDSLESQKVSINERFLHNGAYPCYQIYKSLDKKSICLAAIETKYWNNFLNCFNLVGPDLKRFDTTNKTTILLKNMFSKLNSDEIREKTKHTQTCLTIV